MSTPSSAPSSTTGGPQQRPVPPSAAAVAEQLAASRLRSSHWGVDVDRIAPPHRGLVDPGNRLAPFARPVLDAVLANLPERPLAVVLADTEARIVDCRVGEGALRPMLDDVSLTGGHDWSERYVGTNAGPSTFPQRSLQCRWVHGVSLRPGRSQVLNRPWRDGACRCVPAGALMHAPVAQKSAGYVRGYVPGLSECSVHQRPTGGPAVFLVPAVRPCLRKPPNRGVARFATTSTRRRAIYVGCRSRPGGPDLASRAFTAKAIVPSSWR
jgi:hypothetical protein